MAGEVLDYVPVEKYRDMVRMMEEFRASWFGTLSVFLLRNDLRVVVTPEEIIKACSLRISKNDLEDGSIEFVAEVVELPEEKK